MKTLSINAVPRQWTEILGWIAAGDEVQFTSEDKPVARLLPAEIKPASNLISCLEPERSGAMHPKATH